MKINHRRPTKAQRQAALDELLAGLPEPPELPDEAIDDPVGLLVDETGQGRLFAPTTRHSEGVS